MYENEPTRHNRNGVRPKYLLLAVDGAGQDWYWRTTDDTILAIDDTEIVIRGNMTDAESPEAAVAAIADEFGITRAPYGKQYNATVADALEVT